MSGSILPAIARDRIWESFRALVGLETQQMRFLGTYEYTIQAIGGSAQTGFSVDATANDTSTGMPDVSKAELRADTIAVQIPTVGNLCHIIFVDGNPAKPKCVWCQPQPQFTSLGGDGPPVVRLGDAVAMGTLVAGPYTVAQTVPPTTLVPGLSGIAVGGSAKVTCG